MAENEQPEQEAREEKPEKPSKLEPTVVGIGASAGGLAALKAFFAHVPEDSGLAFVVVVHLSPERESYLAELLQPHVKIPVTQVAKTVPLEPNHVYVIPPNTNLSAIDSHLRLSELEEQRRERAPIDHFFRTLAKAHDGHGIGVILTGTGSDGALGIKEIKEKGGLTVVQDPAEAEYDGMPRCAIATGTIDLVLRVAEMFEAILQFTRTEPRVPDVDDGELLDGSEGRLLQKMFAQLRARTGRDFSRYKRSTILRRIARRMQFNHIEEFAAYLDLMREQTDEVRTLSDDLLITVTNFFRDPEVFDALAANVIPRLFEGKGANDEVRVWSVGCATGEEAYSLSMLLLEAAGRCEVTPNLRVFASDLHEHSLGKAREGLYPGDIATDISAERLRRFFVKEDTGYRIRKEVREMVVFAPHNLLADPPFSRLDLIACRNVMIYLERDIQRDIIALFHYALRQPGFLVLGPSETIETGDLFNTEDKKRCIYRKRNVQAPEPRLPVFPLVQAHFSGQSHPAEERGEPLAYGRLHQQMVEYYAPPSMLVSPDDKVVHLSRHAGRYLVLPGGELTASVFKLVREELRIELRTTLFAAREGGEYVRSTPIPVRFNGETDAVVLHVRPALEPHLQGFALVVFDEQEALDTAALPAEAESSSEAGAHAQARVREMEAELGLTKQRLQAIIEEYETSQEEMKASNEEFQSTNEELRSTMEELETSKEELQSMNEELQTVNQENRHKMEELSQLSGDLQNLLTATDIATLFLDRNLRILRFTPKVGELFNVRMTDRGRPISNFTHHLGYEDMLEDARCVLEKLVPIEKEIQDTEGRWYLTRVLPYRSTEDRIEGVVITFVEITESKKIEEALRESETRLSRELNTIRRLHRMTMNSVAAESLQEALEEILEAAIEIQNADFGNIQLLSDDGEALEIVAQQGFSQAFLDMFRRVDAEDDTACGRAFRTGRRVTVQDVTTDEAYAPYRQAAEEAGYRAVQSTPLVSRSNEMLGVLSVHLREPGSLPEGEIPLMDLLARQAADLIERLRMEEKLQRLNETLEERVEERTERVRELAGRLTMAEQAERHRISQILHDDLQQILHAVELKIDMVHDDLQKAGLSEPGETLTEARSWLEQAVATTRKLTVDLSPPVLQNEGLVEALRWLQRQMKELHRLEVTLEAGENIEEPKEDIRVLLFQAVRELLFNVKKHAGVDHATVRVAHETDRLVIQVSDEGDGFDLEEVPARPAQAGGVGLFHLRERLHFLGGRLEVRSRPGEGTHIEIHAPPRSGREA